MVPTFVPVAGTAGADAAAEGAAGKAEPAGAEEAAAGDAGAGEAAAVPVWARASTGIAKAMARNNLANLLVIGSLVLLEIRFGNYPSVLADNVGPCQMVELALTQTFPAVGEYRQAYQYQYLKRPGGHPDRLKISGVDSVDYTNSLAQRQTLPGCPCEPI
jgi:hypothetical protein